MSKLFIIPTPIGNLEDITLRSIRILKNVDLVLAEDTRTTKKLFRHYNIETPLYPFHSHNEHNVVGKYIKKLIHGKKIGIVSEAGTPAISDPGFLIVRECIKEGLEVDCLPGPTAFIPALVNSGLPCNKFVFEGFLPPRKGRDLILTSLSIEKRTMIFYESPYRVIKTLTQFCDYFGKERRVSVSREISKMFEETKRGKMHQILSYFNEKSPKGEFVIIVEGKK